jgi:hypothetical protein
MWWGALYRGNPRTAHLWGRLTVYEPRGEYQIVLDTVEPKGIGALGRRLVELGWSRDRVLAYVKELFTEPTDPTSGDPDASHKEGRP